MPARRFIRHSTIAREWYAQGYDCPFPALRIDPGEPCCFGCGWRTPSPSAAEHDGPRWSEWDLVGGLLEKAHLVDHSAAPDLDVEPLNYALLCRRCHKAMTPTVFGEGSEDAAIAWILSRPSVAPAFQVFTDGLDWEEIRVGNLYARAIALNKTRDRINANLAATLFPAPAS